MASISISSSLHSIFARGTEGETPALRPCPTPTAPTMQRGERPTAALVVYGRVGTYEKRTAGMSTQEGGSLALWHNCAQSILEKVVRPWQQHVKLDVFVQSWNPELASEMDSFWEPAASWHAPQNSSFKCPKSFPPMPFCERTWWAMLGMRHAIEMRATWVSAAMRRKREAREHDTIIMMRHDLFWLNEMPVVQTSVSATRLWLPFSCKFIDIQRPTAEASHWASISHHSNIFGHSCNTPDHILDPTDFCENTIQIDW
eukprot:scaffold6508_cov37-Tisochrysis_lutea.AAC.2